MMQNNFCKTGFDRWSKRYIRGKRVKDRKWTVFCLPSPPSASLIIFFLAYLLRTTNDLQQMTLLSGASPAIKVLWLLSKITGQHSLFYSERMLFFSKSALSNWLIAKRFPYKQVYSQYISISCYFRSAHKATSRQTSMLEIQMFRIPCVKNT